MTVLLFGYAHDPMVRDTMSSLHKLNADSVLWSPRDLMNDCELEILTDGVHGSALCGDRVIDLEDVTGIFNRQSNVQLTPEYRELDPNDPLAQHAEAASIRANRFTELAPCTVMNRSGPNGSNSSKPFQSLLIAEHFFIPRTCITNNYEIAADFYSKVGRVIYKSCSGERSIVSELTLEELDKKRNIISNCPVQFQERIEGRDMRVHVVGTATFATEILSTSSDYRYDRDANWKIGHISEEVAEASVALTQKLGLTLSGIDLRFAKDGRVYCFEVNPSPAFSAYQEATGQMISDEIAAQLCV
ncbi:MAG: ATP-grasp domain-containing protein [bacterium]